MRTTATSWLRGLPARAGARRRVSALAGARSPDDHEREVRKACEQIERAAHSWAIEATDFLSPPVAVRVMVHARALADITAITWGGYSRAERVRVVAGREELMAGVLDDPTRSDAVSLVEARRAPSSLNPHKASRVL